MPFYQQNTMPHLETFNTVPNKYEVWEISFTYLTPKTVTDKKYYFSKCGILYFRFI